MGDVLSSGASGLSALLFLVLAGCAGSAADHESLGDRAYAEGHFADALVEYRLALKQGSNAQLRAKAGAAALHGGDLVVAAEEYRALAEEGGAQRVTEGADGLELVAKAAVEADDREGLAAALDVGGALLGNHLAGFGKHFLQGFHGPDITPISGRVNAIRRRPPPGPGETAILPEILRPGDLLEAP